MIEKKIAIIGAGNMGKAIAQGLLAKHIVSANRLILSNPSVEHLQEFKKAGVSLVSDNKEAVKNAEIVILAVKPQIMRIVLEELLGSIAAETVVVSIAAGIRIVSIKKVLGRKQKVVRAMPNLNAAVGMSMTAWVTSKEVTKKQEAEVRDILQAIGTDIQLKDERMVDAFTPIAGSGPAYIFYFIELLESAARSLGFSDRDAEHIVNKTFFGSMHLFEAAHEDPKTLRKRVTSKGGTTEAAFTVFESARFRAMFLKAIKKSYRKAKELSRQ